MKLREGLTNEANRPRLHRSVERRGGRTTQFGWYPAILVLEVGSYPSMVEIVLFDITPKVLRAVADDLEARRALVPDELVAMRGGAE